MKSSGHVKRRLKPVRKLRNFGVIDLDYIQMAKNLADQFTKDLSCNVTEELGLKPMSYSVVVTCLM
jgi:hypothetical protein